MSHRQLLYFDWMVHYINKRICLMSEYFIFNVIGLMTHTRMINGRHVFVNTWMIDGRQEVDDD